MKLKNNNNPILELPKVNTKPKKRISQLFITNLKYKNMYCKHCGKEIDDNSTFCKYCGKSQGNTQKEMAIKPVWIVYIIWTLANFYLLMGEKAFEAYDDDVSRFFYPFTSKQYYYYSWDKKFYDFSEFLVYVFIIPAILFVVYRRYNKQIDKVISRILNK